MLPEPFVTIHDNEIRTLAQNITANEWSYSTVLEIQPYDVVIFVCLIHYCIPST